MKKYDAIVVGARNAGATLAAYLGKSGLQVLLVDRSFFPSDVISTHTTFTNTVETLAAQYQTRIEIYGGA